MPSRSHKQPRKPICPADKETWPPVRGGHVFLYSAPSFREVGKTEPIPRMRPPSPTGEAIIPTQAEPPVFPGKPSVSSVLLQTGIRFLEILAEIGKAIVFTTQYTIALQSACRKNNRDVLWAKHRTFTGIFLRDHAERFSCLHYNSAILSIATHPKMWFTEINRI